MKNKEIFTGIKGKGVVKAFLGLQYWIAIVSYLIILSLSILCLSRYLPDLSVGDVMDTGTLIILKAGLIIVLISATMAFGWEMLQWRKSRARKEQPSLEDIIKDIKKDSDKGDSN